MKYFKKNAKYFSFHLFFSVLFSFLVFSCTSDLENDADLLEIKNDSIGTEKLSPQSAEILPDLSQDKPLIKKNIDENFESNKIKIEKKYGNQWDFCRCVHVNDSLDKLIKADAVLDDTFMQKFDEVELKCKAFLVMSPNQTPDERVLHEKKIKECLKKTGHAN